MGRRNKYDLNFKIKIIEKVLKHDYSNSEVSSESGVHLSQLKRWIKFYNLYGIEGLKPRTNQHYTFDFKLEVILTMNRKSLSLSETSLLFNIPSVSTLLSWKRKYDVYGKDGLYIETRGRPSIMGSKKPNKKQSKSLSREEILLLENKALKAERDYLKKLYALIQKENQRKDKKQ
jgi:transposase